MINWLDERLQIKKHWQHFAEHPVPKHALNPIYCFGGITFLLFLVQVITGIFLALYYQPTPEHAYASVQFIMNEVRFGAIVRSVHHWSANLMVIFCILHMLRVFYTGSYKKPRELNWVVGVLLFIVVLAFGFTGYSLPWDQVAYWATAVGSEMAGGIPVVGDETMNLMRGSLNISDQTLIRFYVAHVIILPVISIILLAAHFIMVRMMGISKEL